jgi:hypothetical protein
MREFVNEHKEGRSQLEPVRNEAKMSSDLDKRLIAVELATQKKAN